MSRDFDQIAARRKPREHTVWVVIDHSLVERLEDLRRQHRLALHGDERENRTPQAPTLAAEIEELEAELEEAAVPFTFRALPRAEYRRLLDEHKDPAGEKRWDPDTFPPALIAASASDPTLTVEQAETVFSEWDTVQAETLFAGAYTANEGEQKIPFSVRNSAATRDSAQS